MTPLRLPSNQWLLHVSCREWRACLFIMIFFGMMVLSGASAEVRASHANSTSDVETPKIFEKYCFDCHGNGAAKGNLALDEMLQTVSAPANHPEWQKAWKNVRYEFMPPAGAERPSLAERRTLTQWIEQN